MINAPHRWKVNEADVRNKAVPLGEGGPQRTEHSGVRQWGKGQSHEFGYLLFTETRQKSFLLSNKKVRLIQIDLNQPFFEFFWQRWPFDCVLVFSVKIMESADKWLWNCANITTFLLSCTKNDK